ncbi:MAG TPA: SUMF1/EgtB/PvdO family nonheme iron enzyme, partial [Longimicrobiales bacterium]|nr:SUMF1/EgtB/PvdO family nonheme iron enzyme [Longimicrobiales bacterium]
SPGTPAYMSPEQFTGEGGADGRSDVYALGALLFEMLAGRPPFAGGTVQSILARTLTEAPPDLSTLRPEVPTPVARAVARALAKDPGDRFPTAASFREALLLRGKGATTARRLPWLVATAAALVVAGTAGYLGLAASKRAEAREAVIRAARLVDERRYLEAYDLAEEAERWIPRDTVLARVLTASSDLLTVLTEPAGAEVMVQRFEPDGAAMAPLLPLGVTPVSGVRVPRTTHRLILRRAGYRTVERLFSSELAREWLPVEEGRRVPVDVVLPPEASTPEGMVAVPGGEYQLTSPDVPRALSAVLEPFLMDRFEVTNQAYAEFVRTGGYERDELWGHAPPEVRGGLVDRTGLPGPRGWLRQRFPDGAERLPVTGVSWWEAEAYCRSVGSRLPTLFEWEMTARDGQMSRFGVIMPWGKQVAVEAGERRANFNSEGPAAVDAFPFGISPHGAYAMAGNVREWTASRFAGGLVVAGGSWQGPAYLYTEYVSEPPSFHSDGLGFRCGRHEGQGDQGGGPVDLEIRTPDYRPVDRAGFETLRAFYRYDLVPPNPRTTDVVETADWTRERIWIDGPQGDSILLYFYAPKSARPPYQAIVYVPGASVFFLDRLPDNAEYALGPAIQAGRALLTVVMDGMMERGFPEGAAFPEPASVGFRDLMVKHATELRMATDYAQSRDDVDGDRIAYVASSWGAGSRIAFAAVDDRYRAVVLVGGGIDERIKPTLPEADNVNFAPYIGAPILMVNGANDEEHPWPTRGEPLWDLLPEPKELVLVEGGGHLPPVEARIPAINRFLDRVLGPVRR